MLLHIAARADWNPDADSYVPAGFDAGGFVHCSTRDQVIAVADDVFAGREDLVLLVIDPESLGSEVVWEDCYESGRIYPHVYGPIEVDAVSLVLEFPPEPDGTFRLPHQLTGR